MKTYVIDIDGTLASSPEKFNEPVFFEGYCIENDYTTCKPIEFMINKTNELFEENNIILFTARGMRTFKHNKSLVEKYHKPILEKWLKENGVKYNEIRFGKPWGPNVSYIDDKNMSFETFLSQ